MEEKNNIRPPRWAGHFLSWFCRPELLEYIEGDLEELFFENMDIIGEGKARRKYIYSVLGLFRPSIIRNQLLGMNNFSLFANYFKVGFRQIKKHKLFAGLNILGLATSMSVCLLIIMILQDQYSYDLFHKKKDRIYRVISGQVQGNGQPTSAQSQYAPLSVGEELENNYSFVESVVKLAGFFDALTWKDKNIADEGGWANQAFLDVFSFGWIAGNQKTALANPNSVVITEAVAKEFFKDIDPVGQILKSGDYGDFIITGVMPGVPRRSHLKFQILLSLSTLDALEKEGKLPNRDEMPYNIYALINKGASKKDMAGALAQIAKKESEKDSEYNYYFEPQLLSDISPGPDMEQSNATPNIIMYFLMGLGLLIILSACFNYTNLSLARSLKRSKEIGVRKVIGAKRGHIIMQFVVESVLISLLSLVLALFILEYLISAFYNLDPFVEQVFYIEKTPAVYLYFLLFSILVGLVAGLFPALHISSFKPVQVLNKLHGVKLFSRLTVRRLLLVVQFSMSLVFIMATLLVIDQQQYFVNSDLGIRTENVLYTGFSGVDYDVFKERMEQLGQVIEISGSMDRPLDEGNDIKMAYYNNKKDSVELGHDFITGNHISNMDIKLLAGTTFPEDASKQNEQYIILNEMAVEQMGFGLPEDAIGKTIEQENNLLTIIGVVKNFHYSDILFGEIKPFAFRYSPEKIRFANIRTTGLEMPTIRREIKEAWTALNAEDELYPRFLDDRVYNMSRFFTMGSKIVGLVGFLAIVISCMGLLGMVVYAVEGKTKEIGIRKVLGATERGLIWKLSKSFFILLGIAVLIAVPIVFFAGNLWLNNFALHTALGPKIILAGVGGILLLAAATVVSQTWWAARANPVKMLRTE